MIVNITYTCEVCGAVFSQSIAKRYCNTKKGKKCPICKGKRDNFKGIWLIKLYDAFKNMRCGSVNVEAVFIEYNGVSNPRLVIRLADDYFHSDGSG